MTQKELNEIKLFVEQTENQLNEIKKQENRARASLNALRTRMGVDKPITFKEIDAKFMQKIDECIKIIASVTF